jgi:hypothetical protein
MWIIDPTNAVLDAIPLRDTMHGRDRAKEGKQKLEYG